LGLAITQQLVELHGGDIQVESKVGVGTQMTFSVPVGRADQMKNSDADKVMPDMYRSVQTSRPSVETYEGHEPLYTILAVDDEYSSLKAITNLLTVEQYAVTAVTSGDEALKELAKNGCYDLCILDIMMPGMSGFDVCRIIREKYSLLELPILLVTAKSQYTDLTAGLAAGANDFLEKPYNHMELKSRVGTLVQLKRSADELVRKELSFLQAQIKPHFIYNTLNTILSYSYTDHPRSRKLLHHFSTYLRSCFDFKETADVVPLAKEVALLHAYVEIEKARFVDMLDVDIQIDPAAMDIPIPSLIIQPLVENAIHHGIMKKESGGSLTVVVMRDKAGLYIEVKDDGVGMAADTGRSGEGPGVNRRGVALDNIRKRLFHLYGRPLIIRSEAGKGTSIIVSIPIQDANQAENREIG
jgi:sensor histidine kinase YesM